MVESAFEGTVKEGFKRRFTIVNERDYRKYVPEPIKEHFEVALGNAADWIEAGREEDGKEPFNNYVVINLDEPYIDEIIEVMKRHGHWG